MGFKEARKKAIQCLLNGDFQNESNRANADAKNLFLNGDIEVSDVIDLLKRTNGSQHTSDTHHWDSKLEIHIFRPVVATVSWYIKLYFIDPDVVFISVHLTERGYP